MTLVIQFPLSGGHLSASSKKSCVIIVGVGWFCGHTPFIRSGCVFVYKKKSRFVLKFTPTVIFCSVGLGARMWFFHVFPPFLVPGCPKELVPSSFFFTVAQLQNTFQESQDPFPPILNQDLGILEKKNSWNGVRLRRATEVWGEFTKILLKYDQLESSPIPSEKQIYTILIYNSFCYSIYIYIFGYVYSCSRTIFFMHGFSSRSCVVGDHPYQRYTPGYGASKSFPPSVWEDFGTHRVDGGVEGIIFLQSLQSLGGSSSELRLNRTEI